jgi:Cu/Zn superoxide dismutase
MSLKKAFLLNLLLVAVCGAVFRAQDVMPHGEANLRSTPAADDNRLTRGWVNFDVQPSGKVDITTDIFGLKPGKYALIVHDARSCDGPAGLGPHFDPDKNKRHGNASASEHHTGDLGNIDVDAKRQGTFTRTGYSLSIASLNGRAIALHANADDFKTQPDGRWGLSLPVK